MKIILLVTFVVACVNGGILNAQTQSPPRIIGGAPTNITDVPHQVALLLKMGGDLLFMCGGSVLKAGVVLTAAHCMDYTDASDWMVRAGSSLTGEGGQLVDVSRVATHRHYDYAAHDYDVALMFLSAELALGADVAAVRLPKQSDRFGRGAEALISGWGLIDVKNHTYPTTLHSATVPTVDDDACERAYGSGRIKVTPRMVCAGRIGVGGVDSCQGDSGGPMIVEGVQHGIVSWGSGCAEPDHPGVYSRVASFVDWIEDHL